MPTNRRTRTRRVTEMRGEHLDNSAGGAAGVTQAPIFVQPYLAGEDVAMMAGIEAITSGIQELLKKAGLMKTDYGTHRCLGIRPNTTPRSRVSMPTTLLAHFTSWMRM